jgi:transposase-like protein
VPISWNEIRHNAIKFSRDWAGVKSESAEKQTFWNEFFQVFGLKRRVVASFEEPVKKISGDYGYIDLFWPHVLLVEHKSFGLDLGKAESQAFGYVRQHVKPGSQIFTDALRSYDGLERDYIHQAIDHAECYAKGKVHTLNGLENFWCLLKRCLRGTRVSAEPFHLFRYLDEEAFRFNNRTDGDGERFVKAVGGMSGRHLTYRQLTGGSLEPD